MIKKMLKSMQNDALYIVKRLSVLGLSLWCFYLLYIWYSHSFLLFIGLFIGTGGVLFIVFRHHLMLAIRSIEMRLWGKPLDKMYWDDEKLPKLKFVWKKDRSKQ